MIVLCGVSFILLWFCRLYLISERGGKVPDREKRGRQVYMYLSACLINIRLCYHITFHAVNRMVVS